MISFGKRKHEMKNCEFCGREAPIIVHAFCTEGHCEDRSCIEACDSCMDWANAVYESAPEEPKMAKLQFTAPAYEIIQLTDEEHEYAKGVGIKRYLHAKNNKLNNRYGQKEYNQEYHVRGALGELAVAKGLSVEWKNPVINGRYKEFKKAPDLPGNVEVRTVEQASHRLIVHPDDRDDARFVLAIGDVKAFLLRGWIVGRDAKKKEWIAAYQNYEDSYFVPQEKLRSMDELKNIIRKEG